MIYRFEKGNLNQLEYWFEGIKISDINTIKQKFQQLFQNTTIPAGKTVSLQTEIFETIWANVGLRGSIWNDIPTIINQPVIDNYKVKFANIV